MNGTISEEVMSIYDQMKNSKNVAEQAMQATHSKVNNYAADLSDVRSAAESSFATIMSDLTNVQEVVRLSEERNAALRADIEQNVSVLNKSMKSVTEAQQITVDQILTQKAELTQVISLLEVRLKNENESLENENLELKNKMMGLSKELRDVNRDLADYKASCALELDAIRLDQSTAGEVQIDQTVKIRQLHNQVEELFAEDFKGRITGHDLQISLVNDALVDVKANIAGNTAEIKSSAQRIHHCEDICDIRIPAMYAEQSKHHDKLYEGLSQLDSALQNAKHKTETIDNVVNSLLPLTDQVLALEDLAKKMTREVKSITETLTNSIDTTDEIVRRVDETEETLQGLDESITTRVNRIRDTLMDAMLEKQSETNSAMRNVRENLEVMATAGEGLVAPAPVRNPLNRNAANRSTSHIDISGQLSSAPPDNGRTRERKPAPAPIPEVSAPVKFKAPSIRDAVVVGSTAPASGQRATMKEPSRDTRSPTMNMPSINEGNNNNGGGGGGGGGHSNAHGGGNPHLPPIAKTNSNSNMPQSAPAEVRSTPAPKQSLLKQQPQSSHTSPTATPAPMSGHESEDELDLSTANSTRQSTSNDLLQLNDGSHFVHDPHHNEPGGMMTIPRPLSHGRDMSPSSQYHHQNQQSQQHHEQSHSMSPTPELGRPESTLAATEYRGLLAGNDDYQFHGQAQYLSDLCLNYENISFKKRRVTFIPPVMCENVAVISQEVAEKIASGSDYDMVYNMICQGSNLQSVSEIQYDENFVLNRRSAKMEEYMRVIAQSVYGSGNVHQPPGIVRQGARSLFLSLVKKALEMFMSKHNQVLVVGNSRLGRVKIPSCIACDRPLIEKVRLDTVVGKEHGGQHSISRSAGLGGNGHNASLMSQWGDSDEEDGGGNHITNNNSLILVNIHNNNQVVGGNSIASSRGGSASAKGKRHLTGVRLPSAGTDGSRPKTGGRAAAGGNAAQEDPYVLRGGFKMPRPTTSDGASSAGGGGGGSMMLSSSTTQLPSVNNH
eukprot:gene27942-34728_t